MNFMNVPITSGFSRICLKITSCWLFTVSVYFIDDKTPSSQGLWTNPSMQASLSGFSLVKWGRNLSHSIADGSLTGNQTKWLLFTYWWWWCAIKLELNGCIAIMDNQSNEKDQRAEESKITSGNISSFRGRCYHPRSLPRVLCTMTGFMSNQ